MWLITALITQLVIYTVLKPEDMKQMFRFLKDYRNMDIMQRIQEKQKIRPKLTPFMIYMMITTIFNAVLEITSTLACL